MVKPRQHIAYSTLKFDEFDEDDISYMYIHAGIIVALNNSPMKDIMSILDLDVNFGFFFTILRLSQRVISFITTSQHDGH